MHLDVQEEYTRKTLAWDREDGCFFYPYTPLMKYPAAEELERREADRREAEKDRETNRLEGEENRKLTLENATSARNTAIAAIIVAVVSVIVTIVSIFCAPEEKHVVIDSEISVKQPVEAEKTVDKNAEVKPSPTTSPSK